MDKFLTRNVETAKKEPKTVKKLKQTTIEMGAKVVVEEQVYALKDKLKEAKMEQQILPILDELEKQYISLEMLEKSGIGKVLNRIGKTTDSAEVLHRATAMLNQWKLTAKMGLRRRATKLRIFGIPGNTICSKPSKIMKLNT